MFYLICNAHIISFLWLFSLTADCPLFYYVVFSHCEDSLSFPFSDMMAMAMEADYINFMKFCGSMNNDRRDSVCNLQLCLLVMFRSRICLVFHLYYVRLIPTIYYY
jgi:hypothetical protein